MRQGARPVGQLDAEPLKTERPAIAGAEALTAFKLGPADDAQAGPVVLRLQDRRLPFAFISDNGGYATVFSTRRLSATLAIGGA
jgi:hypothetical protein